MLPAEDGDRIRRPVVGAVGHAVPMTRAVVAVRHQFDQEFVTDATATTQAFGLRAPPWDEVIAATVGARPVTA